MLTSVCSAINHRWRLNVVKTSATRAAGECVTDVFTTFWRSLWSITEQTNGNMESICFIQWSEKNKDDTHTCLIPLDCSRIWASLGIFLSPKCYFSSLLLLFFFILLVYSFFATFFNFFSCSKQNNGENILQNSESLVTMTHNGNCCEGFL